MGPFCFSVLRLESVPCGCAAAPGSFAPSSFNHLQPEELSFPNLTFFHQSTSPLSSCLPTRRACSHHRAQAFAIAHRPKFILIPPDSIWNSPLTGNYKNPANFQQQHLPLPPRIRDRISNDKQPQPVALNAPLLVVLLHDHDHRYHRLNLSRSNPFYRRLASLSRCRNCRTRRATTTATASPAATCATLFNQRHHVRQARSVS